MRSLQASHLDSIWSSPELPPVSSKVRNSITLIPSHPHPLIPRILTPSPPYTLTLLSPSHPHPLIPHTLTLSSLTPSHSSLTPSHFHPSHPHTHPSHPHPLIPHILTLSSLTLSHPQLKSSPSAPVSGKVMTLEDLERELTSSSPPPPHPSHRHTPPYPPQQYAPQPSRRYTRWKIPGDVSVTAPSPSPHTPHTHTVVPSLLLLA